MAHRTDCPDILSFMLVLLQELLKHLELEMPSGKECRANLLLAAEIMFYPSDFSQLLSLRFIPPECHRKEHCYPSNVAAALSAEKYFLLTLLFLYTVMCYHSMMSSVIIIVKEGSLKNAEEELTFDGFVLKLAGKLYHRSNGTRTGSEGEYPRRTEITCRRFTAIQGERCCVVFLQNILKCTAKYQHGESCLRSVEAEVEQEPMGTEKVIRAKQKHQLPWTLTFQVFLATKTCQNESQERTPCPLLSLVPAGVRGAAVPAMAVQWTSLRKTCLCPCCLNEIISFTFFVVMGITVDRCQGKQGENDKSQQDESYFKEKVQTVGSAGGGEGLLSQRSQVFSQKDARSWSNWLSNFSRWAIAKLRWLETHLQKHMLAPDKRNMLRKHIEDPQVNPISLEGSPAPGSPQSTDWYWHMRVADEGSALCTSEPKPIPTQGTPCAEPEVSKAVIETAPIILVFQRFPLLPPCVACGLSWPKRLSESTETLQPLEMCLESLGLQTGASCHCAAKSRMANMLRDACLHSEKILNTLYKTKHIMVV
ncbi:hypothetical protein Anapl_04170 [Anas platyrhynchos]|uniref:Uncharacterized protein n=1 Tax=Anas platyrhynchos TaxID=8839 RepID=R0LSX4_ANAPL|nr:hypothetical protein Anapl_04170 [Anas platyrhynchos]